jgi:hypothetical protein
MGGVDRFGKTALWLAQKQHPLKTDTAERDRHVRFTPESRH